MLAVAVDHPPFGEPVRLAAADLMRILVSLHISGHRHAFNLEGDNDEVAVIWADAQVDLPRYVDDVLSVDGELGFVGSATFSQGASKVDVQVRRYFTVGAAGYPNLEWGSYETLGAETLASGATYSRFSDGSEAHISVDPADERTGRFGLTTPLTDSTQQGPT
jgi:hypothetical protein